jgi:hypothetical protein
MPRVPTWPVLVTALAACSQVGDSQVFTLYRASPFGGDSARVHVATFDSRDGVQYNRQNCDIAAQLFGSQPGVLVRYWCEPGRF